MFSRWLQRSWQKILYLANFLLLIVIISGYVFNLSWVGVGNYYGPSNLANQEFERSKTVWDWLQFFVVPVVLGIGVWWLNTRQEKINRDIASEQERVNRDIAFEQERINKEIAFEKQNQAIMDQYFDRMADLLFRLGDNQSNSDKVQVIARTRTLAVIRHLDGKRRGQILQFLYEANMITYATSKDASSTLPVLDMKGADLTEANLDDTNLRRAVLEGVDLDGASLNSSHLEGIKLQGSTLVNASLRKANLGKPPQTDEISVLNGANMQRIDFTEAILNYAELHNCGLEDAILIKAKLKEAKLVWANLTGAQLMEADLEGAELVNSTLNRANLSNAIMINVNLSGATLDGTILDGANLSGATISSTQLASAYSINNAILPAALADDSEDSQF